MSTRKPVDASFTKRLPKIELHAHLSGSISREYLHHIWEKKRIKDSSFSLEDSLISMPPSKVNVDIKTIFPLFSNYAYRLVDDKASIYGSTLSVLNDFRDDGVIYLELRTTPRAFSSSNFSKNEYVQTILDCIHDFGKEPMSTYLILSVDRRNTAAEAMEVVDLAIKHKARGIVGIDLCGDPSRGNPKIFRQAFSKAKEHGLKLTLHFAEIAASSSEEELIILLSYQPERIGHVIQTSEKIRQEIISRKLALEICLSCNMSTNLTSGGFPNHHFGYWKNRGCPLILCTDDVGIFGSPLSNEYLIAANYFNLGHSDLIKLSEGAVDSVFSVEYEKTRLRLCLAEFRELHSNTSS